MGAVSGGALLLAAIQLVLVILEARRATKPARDAQAARKDATDDLDALNKGIRDKDPEAVAAFFERERLEAWGRITPAADGERVQPPGRDDSKQPDAGPSAERQLGSD